MESKQLLMLIYSAAFLITIALGFNLDTRFPLVFSGSANSYFGYSVGLLPNNQEKWLLVGAPRANSTYPIQKNVVEPGVIFKCSINNMKCSEIPFHLADKTALPPHNYIEMWDNSWLGVSLDIATSYDPFIVVCSHLWKNKHDPKNYLPNGMCIIADSSLQEDRFLRLTPLTVVGQQTEKDKDGDEIYKYGFGLTGMSSHFLVNSKDILLGAPGIADWTGSIVHADENGYRKDRRNQRFQIPKPLEEILPNSYFGYSVSSGSFFKDYDIQLVAGAPRDGPAGKVYIVDTPAIHDPGFIVRIQKEGQQMGEYFGGAVCAVDVNNDHLDDLLVGAPFHSIHRDEGKVYVYINHQEGRSLSLADPLTGSTVVGGRFGSAITAIGDINHDGFNDVAIGAPYEDDRGAVYVYLGSSHGLKLKQKISASTIDGTLRGFGMSISKGTDMDNNRYIDLAIGAYESNKAVVLRSYPVVDVKSDIKFSIQQINMNQATCSLNNMPTVCFTATACVSYVTKNGPETLGVNNTLMLEEAHPKEMRAFILSGINAVPEVTFNMFLSQDKPDCKEFAVHVLNSTVDYLTPIKFSLKTAFLNDHSSSQTFCGNCPVSSPDKDLAFAQTLPFATNCGKDDVCLSDISVAAKIRGQKDKFAFIIGSYESITLTVDVKNAGEPAYQTKATLSIPKDAVVSKLPDNCIKLNSQLVCDVGNPLRHNRMASFDVVFDIGHLPTSVTELKFEVQVNTTSKDLKNDDNIAVVYLPLESDGDIILTGTTKDEQILIQDDNNKSAMENVTNIIHEYKVFKKGHTPINTVTLTIALPATLPGTQNQFVSQIKSITRVVNKVVSPYNECNISLANGIDLLEFPPSSSGNLVLECSNELCYVIQCREGPFIDQENVIISVDLEVDIKLFKELLKRHDYIDLISKGSVKINDLGFRQPISGHPDFAQVTTQFMKTALSSSKPIETWIIIVCILVGIILLIIIIGILYKIGFFRRKEKEEMEKLSGDDHLLDRENEKQDIQDQQSA